MKQELSKNKYVYKRLKLEEIKNPDYFFEIGTKSNLVKILIRLFFHKENFIKIFDFRIISSLILRDLDRSKKNKNAILTTFLFFTLLISLYCLSNKAIIDKTYLNLFKIISGHKNYYKYKEENLKETFNKKKFSIFMRQSLSTSHDLKKKFYVIPIYNKILIKNSEWWKLWIIKEILPSWKISSNSIIKIETLLEEKNTNDLKHFFKLYLTSILLENSNWEKNFNSIFLEVLTKNEKLKSSKKKKILKDTLFLKIFSAFCEKLIFEIENPLKLYSFNSRIEVNNNSYNTKSFFSIPKYNEKKVNPEQFYLMKKNLIQNLKFWDEVDSIIVKSYILIKKKEWSFFNNYAEFSIWQLYKKGLFKYKTDLDEYKKNLNESNINENKLDIKLFKSKDLYSEKEILKADKILSEISYQMSKYILYKIKKSNKLIKNYKIIDQNFELDKKKEPKIRKTLNLVKINFAKSNKFFLKSFLKEEILNNKDGKQTITLTNFWDIFFFDNNKKKIIESNSFSSFSFKNSIILWIKKLFVKNEKYTTNRFFFKNNQTLNLNSKFFFNILSMDELSIAFSSTKKCKKRIRVVEKKKNNCFKYFVKSDNYRVIFLSKVRKKHKNLNYFIFLDYAYKILYKKKDNLKKSVLFINFQSLKKKKALLWFFFYELIDRTNSDKNIEYNIKYNKRILFQIKYFINLAIFLEKLNLLIIKYNFFYIETVYSDLNYQNIESSKLKKKSLITKIICEREKKMNKILIKKNLKIYSILLNFYIILPNNYQLNFTNFFNNSMKFLKKKIFINKIFYYRGDINIQEITKTIVDQNLVNWEKKRKNHFDNIEKNKYISINEKNKKAFELFIKKQKKFFFFSNKINFLNNENLITKWSNKLNKKNIYTFHKNFLIIVYKNFNKIFKLFIYSSDAINTSKTKFPKFQKILLPKKILSKQVKFNIYYNLTHHFYFDKRIIPKFLIDYFYERNDKIRTKKITNIFLPPIWQNEKIYFNTIKISNETLLNFQNFEADTLKLFNFFYYSNLSYKKNLNFYLEKKKNNLIYTQFVKSIALEEKKISNNQLTFFHQKLSQNSNIESKIYKTFLSKKLKKVNYRKLIFLHKFDLNKLSNSLVKLNLIFYKKKINLNDDQHIQNIVKQESNADQINYFEKYLFSEFFINVKDENNQIINWTNKLCLIKYDSKANFEKNLLDKNIDDENFNYEKSRNILSFFSINSIELIPQTKIYKKFKKSTFFMKWTLFINYISWFFTFKWWKYLKNIVLILSSKLFVNIKNQLIYFLPKNSQNKNEKFNYLLKFLLFKLKNKISSNLFKIWNLRLLKQVDKQYNNHQIIWPSFYLNLLIKWNKQYIATITFIIFTYFILQKYFSSLLGSNYFELWRSFEIIQYLIDSSRGRYLDNLIHNKSTKFIKSENLVIHFFLNSKYYVKNIQFYLLERKKINKLLINNKKLDLSRRERKLLVQSLITDKNIEQYRSRFAYNNNYISFQFDNSTFKQQKLKNYLENLTESYQKNLVNYPFHKFYLAENLVFISSWQKATFSDIPWQLNNLKSTLYKKPVTLELRLSYSKGILLVGSSETGRSYLIKNIAANSFVPLIKISINKLLYNKPDIITDSWMNILMESLRRLNLILELAKKLSPCIVWIQNIHELNVNRSTQNVESDPTFLLGIFLKYFQTGFDKKNNHNIVIIGSTHVPKKVDPALISPNRLDQLINIRMFNILQRKKKFSILLDSKPSKYFYSKNKKSSINEFGYRTIGYNARDLAGLINEILLISIVQNKSMIEKKTIRLAFHRQALGSTYINDEIHFTHNYGIFYYKIGKVLAQNLFIKNLSKNPLYFGNDLWKKKFYYLSKWYLEPSIFESTIKEFVILPYILGFLAGLAARDSWFILENKSDNLISLDKYAENDFYLACNILESLLIDFSWLEIFEGEKNTKKKTFNFQFQPKNPLRIIKKGLFSKIVQNTKNTLLNKSLNQIIPYKKELFQLTSNITWAPKVSRLNFIRTNLFNWTNRPNEFKVRYNFDFSEEKEDKEFSKSSHFFEIIQHKTKEQLPYERILSRMRQRNVQELEFQLKDILLEEQFLILGFSRLFTQYRMESRLSTKPMLFIGGRFLWDPTGLLFQNHHFIFSRQNLFIDGEILRRLYVTYGARREREKSRSSQKIKLFFLRRGYGRDSINNFSINWWNQLPFIEKSNIETFKRIEGIGVRLKRPQVFTPVYLYQRWLIENPLENMSRFELLNNQQRWLKINNLLFNDSFIYYILLEIYKYLLNFFISHQILLNKMVKILLRNKWLFQDEIEYLININLSNKIK